MDLISQSRPIIANKYALYKREGGRSEGGWEGRDAT